MARPKRREPPQRSELSPHDSRPAAGKLPPPRPPRPNKWFLLATAMLLALWTGFLVVMAIR